MTEIESEADSNDTVEYPHDDSPAAGVLGYSVFCLTF